MTSRRFPHFSYVVIFLTLLSFDLIRSGLIYGAGLYQYWPDSPQYWKYGETVARGDLFLLHENMSYRTPGYLWFLGALQYLCGTYSLAVIIAVQHLLNVLTSLITARMVYLLSRSVFLATIGYVLLIMLSSRALFANLVMTESVAIFLGTCVLYISLCFAQSRKPVHRWGWFIALSIISGLLILVRPAGVIYVLAGGLSLGLGNANDNALTEDGINPHQLRWRSRMMYGVLYIVVVGIILLPWLLRNRTITGQLTLCTFSGRELWLTTYANWPGAGLSIPEDKAGLKIREALPSNWQDQDWRNNWTTSGMLKEHVSLDHEIDALMLASATQSRAEHPLHWSRCFAARTLSFWYCWNWPLDLMSDAPGGEKQWLSQYRWQSPAWAKSFNRVIQSSVEFHRRPALIFCGLSLLGMICLIAQKQLRKWGIVLGCIMLGMNIMTAYFEIPLYRYRMILEPVMVMCLTLPWSIQTRQAAPINEHLKQVKVS
jgi:hypothetical protein